MGAELEYEVTFVFGSVDVIALAFVDEGDFSDEETLEEVAIRRAGDTVREFAGIYTGDADEVTAKHTATLT